ncbi:MAG: hypothetical protein RI996_576 [Candidatus Parcubacteria bacterium]|jgi:hypothetical protein
MYVDHKQARKVFDALRSAFVSRSYPYNEAVTPQQIVGNSLEKYDKLQQARFWFYACMYMRGPIDSNFAVATLLKIFENQEGLGIFDPDNPDSQNPDVIDEVMTKHKFTRLLSDVKKFWSFSSVQLAQLYAGDPRKIYEGVTTFEEIEARCRYNPKTKSGFMGFQKKMTSMVTYFLRDLRLIGLKDFPPPVDFHLMRIMVLTGVVKLSPNDPRTFRYETSSVLGYEAVTQYLSDTGCCPIELGDCLWLLSGNLCNRSPKNREMKSFGTFDVDLIDSAATSKKKRLAAQPGLFEPDALPLHVGNETRNMRETCHKCPAFLFCKGGMPAVEYYAYGKLHLRQLVSMNK